MKIRNGFVSNSSSTSYIVAVPADFDFKKDWIGEIIVETIRQEGIEITDDEFEVVDIVRKILESIRKTQITDQEDIMEETGAFSYLYVIGDILDRLGLCLYQAEAAFDNGRVINVLSEDIKSRLKDILERYKTCLE